MSQDNWVYMYQGALGLVGIPGKQREAEEKSTVLRLAWYGETTSQGPLRDEMAVNEYGKVHLGFAHCNTLSLYMHNKTFVGIFAVSLHTSGGVATSQQDCPADRFAKISSGFCETIQNGTFLEDNMDLHEWLCHKGLHILSLCGNSTY